MFFHAYVPFLVWLNKNELRACLTMSVPLMYTSTTNVWCWKLHSKKCLYVVIAFWIAREKILLFNISLWMCHLQVIEHHPFYLIHHLVYWIYMHKTWWIMKWRFKTSKGGFSLLGAKSFNLNQDWFELVKQIRLQGFNKRVSNWVQVTRTWN
jgi:hypothetical protein